MDFNLLEKKYNVELPEFYKSFFDDYPQDLLGFNVNQYDILNKPEEIDKLNQELRNGKVGLPWQETFFAIGHDGFGNVYFLDLSRKSQSIYFAEHDMGFDPSTGIERYKAFWGMEEFAEEMKSLHQMKEEIKAEKQRKRWWEIWK